MESRWRAVGEPVEGGSGVQALSPVHEPRQHDRDLAHRVAHDHHHRGHPPPHGLQVVAVHAGRDVAVGAFLHRHHRPGSLAAAALAPLALLLRLRLRLRLRPRLLVRALAALLSCLEVREQEGEVGRLRREPLESRWRAVGEPAESR